LDLLFAFATKFASGEIERVRENGKEKVVTMKQRQMWAHVAAYVGQIMGNLAKGYDERQMDGDLAELERLVNEIRKEAKAREAQAAAQGAPGDWKPSSSKPQSTQ